jgi:hypothetical protein
MRSIKISVDGTSTKEAAMKLTVPAIATPDPGRPGSAESTSLLLEQIDAVLAQTELAGAGLAGPQRWPGTRPFTPAA